VMDAHLSQLVMPGFVRLCAGYPRPLCRQGESGRSVLVYPLSGM